MAQHRKRSVRLWLPLLPAAVAVSLLALVVWLVERIVGDELERRAQQRVEQTSAAYADQVSRVLARRAAELELIATMPALGMDIGAWRQQIDRLKNSSPAYVWIGATDTLGNVIVGSDGLLQGHNIGQRPVFLEGSRGLWFGSLHPPLALVEPLRSRQLPVPKELADIAQPYRNSEGERAGVFAAHLDAAFFESARQRALGAAETQRGLQIELADSSGERLLGERPPVSPAQWARLIAAPAGAGNVVDGTDGEPLLLVRTPVVPTDSNLRTDWQVVAWQPLSQVLAPVRELQRSIFWAAGAATLLLGGLGFWLSRRLARPYSEVLDAVAERLDPNLDAAPGAVLRVIAEQMRRLPARGVGSPGEQALAQVLHDASRLQAVLDSLPAPVYLVDMGYQVIYWNRAAEAMFGWSAAEAQGRHVDEIFHEKVPDSVRLDLRREMAKDNRPRSFVGHMVRRDGSEIWGEWHLTKLLGADGAPVGVLAQVRDLTAERQGEQRLREQGEVLAAVINAASDAVISVNVQGRISLFNPAAARIFGRSAESMLGQPLELLLPPEHRGDHLGLMRRFSDSNATTRPMGFGRVRGLRADGSAFELEASISQVTVRGEKLLTAILRDVSERVRAEQALARYQVELSELTQRLLHQEQVTTRDLAQTLHDQLGQTLGAIRLSYDVLGNMTREHVSPKALERAQIVGRQIDQAIAEVRQALVKLRPPLLEKAGLVAALDNELRQRRPEADPVGLELVCDGDAGEQRWPEDVEYAAFMVAREAVANALEHARCRQVRLRVQGNAERLRLDIGDDGIGLPDEVAFGRPGHLGMVGMRERALAIGARLQARARSDGGTLITLTWTARPDSDFSSLEPTGESSTLY
jgi:PAS domain S-box-containing protein